MLIYTSGFQHQSKTLFTCGKMSTQQLRQCGNDVNSYSVWVTILIHFIFCIYKAMCGRTELKCNRTICACRSVMPVFRCLMLCQNQCSVVFWGGDLRSISFTLHSLSNVLRALFHHMESVFSCKSWKQHVPTPTVVGRYHCILHNAPTA